MSDALTTAATTTLIGADSPGDNEVIIDVFYR